MREIKFRAWLPHARRSSWSGSNPPDRRKKGRMLDFDELYFSISRDSLMHPQIFTDTPEHFYGEDLDTSEKGAILLQYTGLKDKNGQEIYEGDIVKYSRPSGLEKRSISSSIAIEWSDFYAQFNIKKSRARYCSVIGNIYENPELLEK